MKEATITSNLYELYYESFPVIAVPNFINTPKILLYKR